MKKLSAKLALQVAKAIPAFKQVEFLTQVSKSRSNAFIQALAPTIAKAALRSAVQNMELDSDRNEENKALRLKMLKTCADACGICTWPAKRTAHTNRRGDQQAQQILILLVSSKPFEMETEAKQLQILQAFTSRANTGSPVVNFVIDHQDTILAGLALTAVRRMSSLVGSKHRKQVLTTAGLLVKVREQIDEKLGVELDL